MNVRVCPFCSVVSVVPHQSQQACIQALQTEIEHTRHMLERMTERPIAGAAVLDLRTPRSSVSERSPESSMRMSLRCAADI
jgi:hypothetical protein